MAQGTRDPCLADVAAKTVRRNGITQVIMGIICAVFGIAQNASGKGRLASWEYSLNTDTGAGIWCGLMISIGGSITVNASRTRSPTKVVAAFITNLLALLVGLSLTGLSLFSIYQVVATKCDFTDNYGDDRFERARCRIINGIFALSCVLLMLSVTQIVLTIVNSVFIWRAIRSSTDIDSPSVRAESGRDNRIVYLNSERKKRVRWFGATQIIIGLLTFVFGIAVCAVTQQLKGGKYSINGYIGTGVWCGLFFVTAGSVTVSSTRLNNHRRMVVSCIVNALALFVATIQVVISVASCTTNEICSDPKRDSDFEIRRYRYNLNHFFNADNVKSCQAHNSVFALDIIHVLFGLVAAGATIGCLVLAVKELQDGDIAESTGPTVTASFQLGTVTVMPVISAPEPGLPPPYHQAANAPPKTDSDMPPSYDSLQFI